MIDAVEDPGEQELAIRLARRVFEPLTVEAVVDAIAGNRSIHLNERSPTLFDEIFSETEFWSHLPYALNIRAVFAHLKQARIRPDDAKDMYEAGATLCVSGLERSHAGLLSLANNLKQALGFLGEIDVKAYFSPCGSGFSAHYDPRGVTTLQISGQKRWRFTSLPAVEFPLVNSDYPLPDLLDELTTRTDVQNVILHPGDLLYLPPGVIHWAEAGQSSLALNMSFEYVGANAAQMLCGDLLRSLEELPELRGLLFANSLDSASAKARAETIASAVLARGEELYREAAQKLITRIHHGNVG
jgi:ribosomal protein L16 Arg81 hydroxylase